MSMTLEELRSRIQQIEGRPAGEQRAVSSGLAELDELAGGLPQPGLVQVVGPRGSGRMRLVSAMASVLTARGERVAWVDHLGLLYPPTLEALGVELHRLLVVQPGAHQAAWSVEQLLRSGCFPIVFALEPPEAAGVGARWAHAARRGCCTLVAVVGQPQRELTGLRMNVERDGVSVHHRGRSGVFSVPSWPAGLDPRTA